jgi:hypothetical protein
MFIVYCLGSLFFSLVKIGLGQLQHTKFHETFTVHFHGLQGVACTSERLQAYTS